MLKLSLVPLLLLLAACSTDPARSAVMDAMAEFPDQRPYKWEPGTSNTGVPADFVHQGQVLIPKSTEGTFCCGYTLIVGHRAGQTLGLFDDKSVAQMRQFHSDWYGMQADLGDPLISTALENLDIGHAVAVADARRGDFLQFWRVADQRGKVSGHSVVFTGWLTSNGERVGIRYRSSNAATDGIADFAELFAEYGGRVDTSQLHFARFGV